MHLLRKLAKNVYEFNIDNKQDEFDSCQVTNTYLY